jgi:hypothetical protein
MTAMTLTPDRQVYIRSHTTLAALAMGGGMAILWALGNPHVWTGAIGGIAAIGLRGWYLMDEELGHVWTLSPEALEGPQGRRVARGDLATVRTLGHAVQVVTVSGDKHLIKYQPEPAAVAERLRATLGSGGQT